jgi:hypothetical protein
MASRWPRTAFSMTLLGASWISGARADEAPRDGFRLVWVRGDGTESCGDRASIAEGITRRVGRPILSDSAPRSVEGVLLHEGDSWEAHIYVRDENGTLKGSRVLTSQDPSCGAIQTAATLAIALAIDPEATFRAPLASPPPSSAPSVGVVAGSVGRASAPSAPSTSAASPPASATSPPAAASPATSLPATPPPAPTLASPPVERPPLSNPPQQSPQASAGSAGLRAVVAFGLLPSTAPGLALSTEVPLYRWLRGAAGVLYLPEQPTASGDFAFGLTVARLGACARAMESLRATLSLCADVLAGAIHSVVLTLQPVHPGDRAWAGAAIGAVLHAHLAGPLEGQIGADLVVPFTRYPFVVQGGGTAFQEAPAGAVFFAGAGLSIP